jgi:hypothetical protein
MKTKESESERLRWLHVARKYGITKAEYFAIYERQSGACAICGNRNNGTRYKGLPLYIDHDHKTRKVRGLLCNKCNVALGMLGENTALFEKIARYLNSL